jgi:hypothetical protein
MDIDKRNALRDEFNRLPFGMDTLIDQLTFFNLLDTKANHEYDRFTARQLFERSDFDKDGRITLNEFLNTWLEAEHVTISKIQREQIRLPAFQAALAEIQQKMNQASRIPNPEYRKQFIYRIVGLEGFTSRDPTFHVSTNDLDYAFVRYADFQNTDLIMDLDPTDESLRIFVNPPNIQGKLNLSEAQGRIVIPLNLWESSDRLDKTFVIPTQFSGQGSIRIQGGIVHNQQEYYKKMIQQNQTQMSEIQTDIQEYKETLKTLYLPFPSITSMSPNQYIDQMGTEFNHPYNYDATRRSAITYGNSSPMGGRQREVEVAHGRQGNSHLDTPISYGNSMGGDFHSNPGFGGSNPGFGGSNPGFGGSNPGSTGPHLYSTELSKYGNQGRDSALGGVRSQHQVQDLTAFSGVNHLGARWHCGIHLLAVLCGVLVVSG